MNDTVTNPSSQTYWWPAVSDLRIPVPKTIIVPVYGDAESLIGGCVVHDVEHDNNDIGPECAPLFYRWAAQLREAGQYLGYPLFARTDLVSGKHQYSSTCHVPDEGLLMNHIRAVLEEHAMALWMEPDSSVRGIVLREMLQLESLFVAFSGLPIAIERRYFVEGSRVVCHHPYWPQDAIQFYGKWEEREGWREMLRALNEETPDEIALLSEYAERVGRALHEHRWSVDFAKAEDGIWYLIDMALAERSWHPEHEEATA